MYGFTKYSLKLSRALRYVILSGNKPMPYLGSKWAPLAILFKGMTWTGWCPCVPSGLTVHIPVLGSCWLEAGKNQHTRAHCTFSPCSVVSWSVNENRRWTHMMSIPAIQGWSSSCTTKTVSCRGCPYHEGLLWMHWRYIPQGPQRSLGA